MSDHKTYEERRDADVEMARSLGFYAYWGPSYGEGGWVSCTADHPGARPDLNRLLRETEWDAETQSRVLKDGKGTE